MFEKNIPTPERLRITLCLSLVGGFLETYTYRLHGGVFANAQTGNLVLLALSLVQGSNKALSYLIPIIAFVLGVFASEKICERLGNSSRLHWLSALVMLEAAVLAVVPFFPASTPDGVVIVLVSFVSSLQFNGFQRTHGMACSTVVCTANLRSACKHLYHALTKKDFETALSSAKYLFIIGFFVLGACISFWAIELWEKSSIWLCSIMLVIVHFILVITERSK